MLCQNCKKREATVNRTETVGGKTCSQHLRALCANELFGDFENEFADAMLSGLFDDFEPEEKVCPGCGLTFAEYERTGLLGCPSCYDVFNGELLPYIARIQGKTVHVGKGGGVYTTEHELRRKLTSLQKAMDDALARGNYAEAGRINEQMNALKKRNAGVRKW